MKATIAGIAALFMLVLGVMAQPLHTAPVLLYPVKGTVVNARDQIPFRWSLVARAENFFQNSILEIVEILPDQSVAQALRANTPVITRSVPGMTLQYLSQMDFPMHLGDSMHFAWKVTPLAPGGIVDEFNGSQSEPEDFWLVDGLRSFLPPQYPSRPSPCGLVDAGRDQTIRSANNEPVTIGSVGDDLFHYEWISDPPGYHAYQSQVRVSPPVTTRYVVIRTDTATNCVVTDEVWVKVEKPFRVDLVVDACGNIHAVVSDQNTNPAIDGRLGLEIQKPEIPCPDGSKLPQPASSPPGSIVRYEWSNGSRNAIISPELGGPLEYRVTVTVNSHEIESRITLPGTPNTRFKGEFPTLIVPKAITLGNKAFKIEHQRYAAGMAAYNATSYRLTVFGPGNYIRTQEGYTQGGFPDKAIYWDEALIKNNPLLPGNYYWILSLRNCDYPIHDPFRLYRVCKKGGDAANPTLSTPNWTLIGKFIATR